MPYTGIKLGAIYLFLMFSFASKGQEKEAYLNPPEIIDNPAALKGYSPESREFTGIPSIAISAGGRMWSVWYAGPSPDEDQNNYVVLSSSGDAGNTWQEVLVIDPDGPGIVRAFDPELWMDPDGMLWVFWAQAPNPEGGTLSLLTEGTLAGVWALKIDNPEELSPQLSSPFRITDGVMMCKPTVLSSGEWVLPVSMWKMEEKNARMVVSKDAGGTWKVRGGASVPDSVRAFDEHHIVERMDASLWMLIRTTYGIGESVSNDRGKSWSPVTPSKICHPSARFSISRLNSGKLLLVKHGPIDMRTGRSHLMAFISENDGLSWSDGLLLDERDGISYPDVQQTRNGTIHIIYDYSRTGKQHILFTSFTEEDILSENDNKIIEVYKQRTIISQGGSSPE